MSHLSGSPFDSSSESEVQHHVSFGMNPSASVGTVGTVGMGIGKRRSTKADRDRDKDKDRTSSKTEIHSDIKSPSFENTPNQTKMHVHEKWMTKIMHDQQAEGGGDTVVHRSDSTRNKIAVPEDKRKFKERHLVQRASSAERLSRKNESKFHSSLQENRHPSSRNRGIVCALCV